ncbi:uncharacterized protein LOC143033479 [Oratosquilla oratoria]|uniref:uncharacterized protein LOC143033479 n=1 Tax=Oratosquilla oratoria TaxID=337810 RepID=UPI003F76E8D6
MVFTVRQIQERCIEQNLHLYTVLIELTKAFDTVNREALWVILTKLGCAAKFPKLIQLLHDDMTGEVLSGGEPSDRFSISNGLKQGCVLAPVLFNLFFTQVLRHAVRDLDLDVYIKYRLDGSLFDLRRLASNQRHSRELSLKLSSWMTVLLSFITIDGTQLSNVTTRIQKASQAFGRLRSKFLQRSGIGLTTKLKVYRAVVLTSLLYGCETWTLYRRHVKQLEQSHQRSLRSIMRIRWYGRITNKKVLARASLTSIKATVLKTQLRQTGHVICKDTQSIPRQVSYCELASRYRKKGRPKRRFKD